MEGTRIRMQTILPLYVFFLQQRQGKYFYHHPCLQSRFLCTLFSMFKSLQAPATSMDQDRQGCQDFLPDFRLNGNHLIRDQLGPLKSKNFRGRCLQACYMYHKVFPNSLAHFYNLSTLCNWGLDCLDIWYGTVP